MSWLHSQMALLTTSTTVVELALNWLLQSTLLIGLGLLGGRLLQRRGSAVQSVVYRTTLAAVLLCPIASTGLWLAGVSGWSVALPEPWTVAAVTVDATPTAPPTPRQLEPLETLEANRVVIGGTTETDSLSTQPLPPQQFPPQETAGPIVEEALPAALQVEPTPVAVIPPTASPVALSVQLSGWIALAICTFWLLLCMPGSDDWLPPGGNCRACAVKLCRRKSGRSIRVASCRRCWECERRKCFAHPTSPAPVWQECAER